MTRNELLFDNAAHPTFNIIVLPGGVMPFRALPQGAKDHASSRAMGYDIPIRAVVELEMDSSNPLMRKTIYDFKNSPEPKFEFIYVQNGKFVLFPGKIVYLGTGVVLEMPPNTAAWVKPRGSAVTRGLSVLNSDVPIDPDFRGEPVIMVRNENEVEPIFIEHSERLAQFVFTPVILPEFKETASLEETIRGNGSHGSTGK